MTKRILVAAHLDESLLRRLEGDDRFSVTVSPAYAERALAESLGDAQILITRYHNQVTRKVIEAGRDLELIVQGTTGLDNIDLAAAAERKIEVLGIPGENANAVAEFVVGLMISLTRTIPAYDRMMRSGIWQRDDCSTRRELRSHRLGIVGIGRVGSRVAALAKAFDVRSVAYDPYVSAEEVQKRGATKISSLDELLLQIDILTLHVPLTKETRQMIGPKEIETLPAGSILINASRGAVLDTAAVVSALERGHLAGAALDVFEEEPPRERQWPDLPQLILTPHIAGCSRESKASIGGLIYEKICGFCRYEPRD